MVLKFAYLVSKFTHTDVSFILKASLLFWDMFGQRQLHDEAINVLVEIQSLHTGQQICFRDVILKA